jgi:hypothetical protein
MRNYPFVKIKIYYIIEIMDKAVDNVIDQYLDNNNCNIKEKELYKCFKELDNKIFFRKRKYRKCMQIENDFRHCLVYSNENKITKREPYRFENSAIEIHQKYKEQKIKNKKDAYDFVSGNKTESEIINKNTKSGKNVIEL